jgi:hypothetical protein
MPRPRAVGREPVLLALEDVAMVVAHIEWVRGSLAELKRAAAADDQLAVERLVGVCSSALSDARGILGRRTR